MTKQNLVILIVFILCIALIVITAGYFLTQKYPIVPQVQNNSETAGWKTYKNDEYGFEFKYPAEAEVKNITDDVLGNTPAPNECTLLNFKNNYIYIGLPPHSILCGGTTGLGVGDTQVTEEIKLGSETWTLSGWKMLDADEFYSLERKGMGIIYGIRDYAKLAPGEYQIAKNLNHQILSTFKFTK